MHHIMHRIIMLMRHIIMLMRHIIMHMHHIHQPDAPHTA